VEATRSPARPFSQGIGSPVASSQRGERVARTGCLSRIPQEDVDMPIVRSIEVIAQSPDGFDAACQEAVREASKTLRGIRSFWIKNAECVVENDRIVAYRVNGKISFPVERD
jgi:flavin-binding protein dodecin